MATTRTALRVGSALILALGVGAIAAPGAQAAAPDYEVAFQASSGVLTFTGNSGTLSTGVAMAADTSPSIGVPSTASFLAYFQTSGAALAESNGSTTPATFALTLAPHTSPAYIVVPRSGSLGGYYQVAYQGTNGDLWLYGHFSSGDTGLAMAPNTSPSLTLLQSGGYEVAYQSASGYLKTMGSVGSFIGEDFPMEAGTSPSIVKITGLAYNDFTTNYWVSWNYDDYLQGVFIPNTEQFAGTTDDPTMAPGTSPGDSNAEYSGNPLIAFQGTNGHLELENPDGTADDSGVAMAPGASPAITEPTTEGNLEAFQGANGDLWLTSTNGVTWSATDEGLAMATGTTPSITGYVPCSGCRIQ